MTDQGAFRAGIQRAIDEFIAEQGRRLAPLGPDATMLLDEAAALLAGGKRLRGAFCHWGFRAFEPTGYDERGLERAAASLEVLHASALIHDDLMDASDTRRGRPSTHRGFERFHANSGWSGDPEQYGESAAILLGDLLLTWADEMLRGSGFAPEHVSHAMDVLDLCRSEVIVGQFLDVSVQARGYADVDDAMRVLRYKSAKYSIERPLHIGAALGGADAEGVAALTAYGLPLGEAFQLRDDLIGVFGDPEATGKPAGDDLAEGKRTVLVALALDAADEERATYLNRKLGSAITDDELQVLRQIFVDTGAKEQVEQVIDALVETSLKGLSQAPIDELARAELARLADAATRRDV